MLFPQSLWLIQQLVELHAWAAFLASRLSCPLGCPSTAFHKNSFIVHGAAPTDYHIFITIYSIRYSLPLPFNDIDIAIQLI